MALELAGIAWALLIGAGIGWWACNKYAGPTKEEQIVKIVEATGEAISKATGTWSSGIVTNEEQEKGEVEIKADWVLPEGFSLDDPWMREEVDGES